MRLRGLKELEDDKVQVGSGRRAGTSPESDEGDANDIPLILIYMMRIGVAGVYCSSPAMRRLTQATEQHGEGQGTYCEMRSTSTVLRSNSS